MRTYALVKALSEVAVKTKNLIPSLIPPELFSKLLTNYTGTPSSVSLLPPVVIDVV